MTDAPGRARFEFFWRTSGLSGKALLTFSVLSAIAALVTPTFDSSFPVSSLKSLAFFSLAGFIARLWLGKLLRLLDTNYRHTMAPLVKNFWNTKQELFICAGLIVFGFLESYKVNVSPSEGSGGLILFYFLTGCLSWWIVFYSDRNVSLLSVSGDWRFLFAVLGVSGFYLGFVFAFEIFSIPGHRSKYFIFQFLPMALVLQAFLANYVNKWILPAVLIGFCFNLYTSGGMVLATLSSERLVWGIFYGALAFLTIGLPVEKWK